MSIINAKTTEQPTPPPAGPFRVNRDDVTYTGVVHRYTCVIKRDVSAADLLRPGAFDDCTLRPWDVVEVVFGATPQTAKAMRLLVVATPKTPLRFERQAGLIERAHTIVAVVDHAKEVTPNWGDEAPTELDESRPKGKAA